MKRVIHIGEGKHIEITEGALRNPPPVSVDEYEYDQNDITNKWHQERATASKRLSSNIGKCLGLRKGGNKQDVLWEWKVVKEQVKRDMAIIKSAGIVLDDAAEEALGMTLELMRGPGDGKLKLAAARQVLEWTKAKPAAKSEVTVNSAEAWLASLEEEDDVKDVR